MDDMPTPILGSKDKLTKEELNLFDWIQEIWEHHRTTLRVVYWNDSKVSKLLDKFEIQESHDTERKTIEIHPSSNNEIQFRSVGGKQISKNFIRHLRNAYAHLHIEHIPGSNNLHIQDWKGVKDELSKEEILICTMDAIVPIESLKELTELILQEYSQNKV